MLLYKPFILLKSPQSTSLIPPFHLQRCKSQSVTSHLMGFPLSLLVRYTLSHLDRCVCLPRYNTKLNLTQHTMFYTWDEEKNTLRKIRTIINQEKNVSLKTLEVLHTKWTVLDSNSMGTNVVLTLLLQHWWMQPILFIQKNYNTTIFPAQNTVFVNFTVKNWSQPEAKHLNQQIFYVEIHWPTY